MNIYSLVNTNPNEEKYDWYDEIIVCALDEEDAQRIPFEKLFYMFNIKFPYNCEDLGNEEAPNSWAYPTDIKVFKIGVADKDIERGVILASFNAG